MRNVAPNCISETKTRAALNLSRRQLITGIGGLAAAGPLSSPIPPPLSYAATPTIEQAAQPLPDMSGPRSQPTSFDIAYRRSLRAGLRDPNGRYISGTEIMHLVPFKGRLYAGNDLWMENDLLISQACQILVLDSPTSQWKVDHQFCWTNLRLAALKAVEFTTDGQGKLVAPISLLLPHPTQCHWGWWSYTVATTKLTGGYRCPWDGPGNTAPRVRSVFTTTR
jgi:hypothetical protein